MDIQISNFLKILKIIFDNEKEVSLDEPIDWEFMSDTARKQNLLPLFFESANKIDSYVNSEVYTKDQLDTFSVVAAQICRSYAFIDVYEKIAANGIYPIVLKGIICRQLYGELGEHRPSSDEDILVEVKDFFKIKKILEQENFQCSLPDVTERELLQIQEVSFYNQEQNLTLEVHTNIIGKETEEREKMNDFFQKVHEHGQIIQVYETDVKVLEPTESLLFLILHAYKHFRNRGVGIRQVIDILLHYREYKDKISMECLQDALKACGAQDFWMDILYIGNQYWGLYEQIPERVCCPEELLQDMIYAGVFGGQEKADYIAASLNLVMEDRAYRNGKLYMLFRAAFPSGRVLLAGYPYLTEKPWLLPVIWGKRWMKFIRYSGKNVWKISGEILQKSSARMEIRKKYRK